MINHGHCLPHGGEYFLSAYGVAVKNGFRGTEKEWLDSLVGKQGEKGEAFTYEDFTPEQLAGLKGEAGTDGRDGIDGANGTDGVSPEISVRDIPGGKQVAVIDAGGTKLIDIMDGEQGVSVIGAVLERTDFDT